MRNHGPGVSFQTQLTRLTPSSEHSFRFELPIGILLDPYDYWGISLKYGINSQGLWKLQSNMSIGYFAAANVRNYYYPEWDDSHLYWVSDYSIGPAIKYTAREFPKLEFYAQAALISLVARSPQHPLSKLDNVVTFKGFFTTPQKNREWRDIRDFQSAAISVFYRANHISRSLWEYRIEFVRIDDPLQFVEAKHLLGWHYGF